MLVVLLNLRWVRITLIERTKGMARMDMSGPPTFRPIIIAVMVMIGFRPAACFITVGVIKLFSNW